jgi:hypothetical protein
MIVDVLAPPIRTVTVAYEAVDQDEHMEDTVNAAEETLRDETGWQAWRFEWLRMDWHARKVAFGFSKVDAC